MSKRFWRQHQVQIRSSWRSPRTQKGHPRFDDLPLYHSTIIHHVAIICIIYYISISLYIYIYIHRYISWNIFRRCSLKYFSGSVRPCLDQRHLSTLLHTISFYLSLFLFIAYYRILWHIMAYLNINLHIIYFISIYFILFHSISLYFILYHVISF